MSEGTMQRPAHRDLGAPPTPFRPWGSDERDQRERRAKSRSRVLVCAAVVPAVLVVAGCSSDSGSDNASSQSGSSAGSPEASASASPSPTVQAAVYSSLPKPCAVVSKKTLGDLVPKGTKSGKEGSSGDTATRAGCSWNSLDNNGVKGSQFRWLNISMLRFESDTSRGSGDKQAQAYYEKQVQDAQSAEGAKNAKSKQLAGAGDEATTVTYDLKKKEGSFKQQTVVTRAENVVITVDYNGAGLAGEKTPSAETLTKLAEKAAKETVAAVAEANGKGQGKSDDGGDSSANSSPSASKSAAPSESSSKSSAKSPSKSASPSESAAKKS
ncbi:DUF3558 family protein [Streptomyces sp. NPDC005263]|uniref:DUF3558 family protein n=1 Tax=Streptomyces sp. NPDC005263 TaxID=3364711 RepID=UPI0036A51199